MSVHYGIRCVSNREMSVKIEGDTEPGPLGGSLEVSDAFAATFPYFGAAIGWGVGELIVAFLQ